MDRLKQSFFEWFDLPERFAIDEATLDAAYRRVQTAVHPDRFAQAPEHERRLAMQWATQANEAYRTLRDPTRRARYLCERHGVDLGIETNTAMAPAFLMRQMEWREQLDDARAAADLAAIDALADELEAARRQMLDRIAATLDEQRDFPAAGAQVRELMFIDRFAQDVRDAIERLDH
ncbi:MAG: Fe-S protein assembly co-chaperone HscB [Burkholderiaceae bacterium]